MAFVPRTCRLGVSGATFTAKLVYLLACATRCPAQSAHNGRKFHPRALGDSPLAMRGMRLVVSLASLVAACSCRMIHPRVVGSSHSLQGYEPERVADGNENTYWLVPGGQRMEAMS